MLRKKNKTAARMQPAGGAAQMTWSAAVELRNATLIKLIQYKVK